MTHLTIHEIKQRIALPEYIGRFVDLKKDGKEYRACCPFHGEKTPSFSVYRKKGEWRYMCFGCSAQGTVIDFAMAYHELATPADAIRHIMDDNAEVRRREPLVIEQPDIYADFEPLPLAGHTLSAGELVQVLNPKRGNKIWHMRPQSVHRYQHGFVVRLMVKGKKITPTVRWCRQISTGLEGWVLYPFRDGEYTFYGELKPFGQVIIVEGEKAVDAGNRIFTGTDTSVIGWAGGTNRVEKTDWSALLDRKVIGIPDNDEPGHDAMWKIKQVLPDMLTVIPDGETKGFDIADRDFTHSELIEWMTGRFGELRPSDKIKPG